MTSLTDTDLKPSPYEIKIPVNCDLVEFLTSSSIGPEVCRVLKCDILRGHEYTLFNFYDKIRKHCTF